MKDGIPCTRHSSVSYSALHPLQVNAEVAQALRTLRRVAAASPPMGTGRDL